MTKQWYLKTYHKHCKADKYIIGFEYCGLVYAKVMNSIPASICRLDTTGRTRGDIEKIRISIPLDKIRQWAKKSTPVCTTDDLYSEVANRGEVFEEIMCLAYGEEYQKDNKPFYECGDFCHDCISYQVKFNNATIANKEQIKRLKAME